MPFEKGNKYGELSKRSKDVLKLVSYHEIGHALIVGLFREMFDLQKITINSNKIFYY